MILSESISVIIQGVIDKQNTPKCIDSIRKYLPKSEIILSTWEGSNTEGLDYDILLLNKDPGAFSMSKWEKNNVKRQIFSTIQGLKKSNREYALKIRSDMKLTSSGFLNFFEKFNTYSKEWHFLKKRIIIPSMITRDPRVWESPMCPSDWCSFGLKEDMLKLWDINFPSEEEEKWFKYHKKPNIAKYYYYPLEARFNPEQFIWCNFIKKFNQNLHTEHMFDVNEKSIKETLYSYANNLIVLSPNQFGIKLLKARRKGSDSWHILTHVDFLKIYNKFANGNAKIPLINLERLSLIKYFYASNSRLYNIAVQNGCLSSFIRKELKYFCPFLYSILKPIITFKNKKNIILEFKNKENSRDIPKISIVIPVHDNPIFFREALDSLKFQIYKNFEVIISDDSAKLKNREKIKEILSDFYKSTGLRTKYIFTKKNLGQSKNSNKGLSYANGEWVRILHSDDLLGKFCLKKEVELIEKNPNVLAIFHSVIPFSDINNINYKDNEAENAYYAIHTADFILKNSMHSHCAIPSSLLFNSELLGKIDAFNCNLVRACDWDFWSRIVIYALKYHLELIHVHPGNIYYRIHSKSNSNNLKLLFKNHDEYEAISHNVERSLKLNMMDVEFYSILSYSYRKRRLIYDYKKLNIMRKFRHYRIFIKKLLQD